MQRSCQTILSRKLLEMGYSINIDQKKKPKHTSAFQNMIYKIDHISLHYCLLHNLF